MAISVSVPRDLSKIKTKFALNLTKRQIFCFGLAAAVALPVFFSTRKFIGLEVSAILCMLTASPFFILGLYEKDGVPAEKLIFYEIRHRYLRPPVRKFSDTTRFLEEERKENIRKEIILLEKKAKK